MSQEEENSKRYDLEERTFQFGKAVRAFVKTLPRTMANEDDIRQLVKASGSLGANYIEANESLSKKDFVLHIKISRKEAKESRYWLRLLDAAAPARSCWRCWTVAMVPILALAVAPPARANETQTVLLPEFNAYVPLTARTRLFLLGSLTQDLTRGTTDGEVGVHLDVTLMPILRRHLRLGDWERERYLWVRVGYRLAGTLAGADDPSVEHRGILEATARVPLPWEAWLVNRGRVDLRDVDGDFSSRLRYRLGLEREFTVWDRALVPYVQAEVFYDTRFGAWSRVRFQAGVELELSEHWRIEPYFRRQEDWRPSRAHENGIGLVLKYYH